MKINYDDYVKAVLESINAYTQEGFEKIVKTYEPLFKKPIDWSLYIEYYDYILSEFLLETLLIQYDIHIYTEFIDDNKILIDTQEYEECEHKETFWELMDKLNYKVTNDPRK